MQCCGMTDQRVTLGEATKATGVGQNTLYGWDRSGKLHMHGDERHRRMVPA